jgi:hypothetical protein
MEFWTSGSNEGEYCNLQNVFNWCSQTEGNSTVFVPEFLAKVGNKYFRNMLANDSAIDRCLAFKLNATKNETSGFELEECNKTMKYICEPKIEAPSCPPTCAIDVLHYFR